MSDEILYERRDPIALITLARPAKLNAISTAMSSRLREILAEVHAAEALRVAILAAEGRFFCAGADVNEYAGQTYAEFVAYQQGNRQLNRLIEDNHKLVIAAVQGPALGGGFELALACDAIIATEDSYFALPEVSLGLIPGGGGTQRLARVLGKTRVKELLVTGKRISARAGVDLGLVNQVVPAGQVLGAALEYARLVAARPPLAVQWAKRVVNQGPDAALETALTLEQLALAGLFVSEDGREGIRAFVEKREPRFEGK
jgi:enoyl-CoA hydratase/carnithine racemase